MNETVPESKPASERNLTILRIKRRLLGHIWLVRVGLLASFLLSIYFIFIFLGLVIRRTKADHYFGLARGFVFTPQGSIRSFEGRTNILILGKGGQEHEAPDLTDTIIFMSIAHKDTSIVLISLPRDIWIPAIRAKLNSAYYWGNQKQSGGGLVLAKSLVEEVVGQPVHYAVIIDFSGFKKIIDVLGSIKVNVERAFTDEKYPIPGRENDDCADDPEYRCRYETLRFAQGKQLMDGETALKFVRSRNAQGVEGTDLAREARQQRLLAGVREKALSREVLLSPTKLLALWGAVRESIETDIEPGAGAVLTRRLIQAKDKIASYVLPETLLVNPPKSPRYDNLYVFIPGAGDWTEVHKWIWCKLEKDCG